MRRALVGAVSVITFVGMGTVVSASIPAADNVFHGCVNAATGLVRVIDPAKSGDLGHCRTTGIQALRETEISWNQQGVPGTPGTPGAAGDQGPVGPQGPKGDTGAQGEKGADGANGDSGEPGPKGDTGAQGPQGPAGTSTGVPAAHTEVIGYLDLDIHAGPLSDVPIRGITLPAPTQGPSGKNDDLAGEMDLALVPDANSIGLMAQIADSRVARQGTLRLTDAQGTPYAEIKLSDVLITGLSLDTGDAAGQTLVLNYAGFELRTGGPLNGIPGAPAGSVGSVALETAAPTSISALSWSVTATVGSSGGGGRPVGRPTFAPITIDLPLGADAWNLLTRHALHRTGPSGRADLAEVTVVHPLSTGSETFTLENVNVDAANITITGTAGSVPTMSTVLSYSKLTRSNGTAEACWDESGKPSC